MHLRLKISSFLLHFTSTLAKSFDERLFSLNNKEKCEQNLFTVSRPFHLAAFPQLFVDAPYNDNRQSEAMFALEN